MGNTPEEPVMAAHTILMIGKTTLMNILPREETLAVTGQKKYWIL